MFWLKSYAHLYSAFSLYFNASSKLLRVVDGKSFEVKLPSDICTLSVMNKEDGYVLLSYESFVDASTVLKFDGKEIEEIQIYAIQYKDDEGKRGKLLPFDIDEDYIEELKGELEETAKKIKNNEFEPICEDCSRCQFKKICEK